MTSLIGSGESRWKFSALHRSVMDGTWSNASAAALCLLLLVGCSKGAERDAAGDLIYSASTTSSAQVSPELDSVFSFIGNVDHEAFNRAFSDLEQRDFTRYMRTEQFDDEDYLIASEERVVRHRGPAGSRTFVTMERDSAGTFDYGYMRPFVAHTVEPADPTDLAQYVVPEDPAYLSARHREAYIYRSLPDTLMWDARARVIEVRARPNESEGHSIRRVRLFIDRGTNRLIAIYLERIDLAMWYREESQFYVHIRPMPGGSWVPFNTRFETKIGVPFRPAQRFRTISTYYDYAENARG